MASYENPHLTTANSFDGAYAKGQLKAHDVGVSLFRGYAQNGQTAPLEFFAQKALPTLEHHLEMIKAINQKMAASN